MSDRGDLVEALVGTGATRSQIAKYTPLEYTVVHTNTQPLDQQQIIKYANAVVGQDYGFLNDVVIFIDYITPNRINISIRNHIMCAGLVARARERAGDYFDAPDFVAPADLAFHYSIV